MCFKALKKELIKTKSQSIKKRKTKQFYVQMLNNFCFMLINYSLFKYFFKFYSITLNCKIVPQLLKEEVSISFIFRN